MGDTTKDEHIASFAPLGVVILKTHTPCCKRRVILRALVDAPREQYDRTCARCGAKWTIERRQVASAKAGVRVDALDWTCTKGVES